MRYFFAALGTLWSVSAMAQPGPQLSIPPVPYSPSGQNLGLGTSAAPTGATQRTLSSRAGDVYNPLDYGALGTNSTATIGTTYGATLAALAAYTTPAGARPFSWATNPLFGLTFQMPVSAAQAAAGASLTFVETTTSWLGWAATLPLWQDTANASDQILVGMNVTGSCIAANTTVAAVGRVPGGATPFGTITLSQPTASSCASGTPITFTISPTQLAALTQDWLGLQAAFAQADLGSSQIGQVSIPKGVYNVNHPIINASLSPGDGGVFPGLDVGGAGMQETVIQAANDLGLDACVIMEANRSTTYSLATYHDLKLLGPSYSRVNGTLPAGMDGLCLGEGAKAYRLDIQAMRAGINGVRDHWNVQDSILSSNGYGIYFAPYGNSLGNAFFEGDDLSGNTVASIAVSASNDMDSATVQHTHTGNSPYGLFYEAMPTNYTATSGSFLTNSLLQNVFVESVGYGFLYGAGQTGIVAGNNFVGMGAVGVNAAGSYIPGGPTVAPAVAYIAQFFNNTLTGTDWGQGYADGVSTAIVAASGFISQNTIVGDEYFVTGSSATVSPLAAPAAAANSFAFGQANGFFEAVSSAIGQGALLADGGAAAVPYADGKPFAGIAAGAAGANKQVAIYTSGYEIAVPKAISSQFVATGQPVFPTSSTGTVGVVGGLDQQGAIGSVYWGGSGATTTINLNVGSKAGPLTSLTGQTASGTGQNAQLIAATLTQFTTTTAGRGPTLALIPIGYCETIYNDGTASMTVWPQTGGSIGTAAVNTGSVLAAGTKGEFCRVTNTLWHQ
jgi:hypothetical protein